MTKSWDTLLVANRGEIACRILRTARHMGLKTVAIFSDVDRNAAHVAMADTAIHVGPSPPAESYLSIKNVVEAALTVEAGAVHPGYGFLSENAEFAEALEAAGLTFVGPSPEAIRKMGNKNSAKVIMERAGVPVVPGYHGADQSDARLNVEAEKIGFPLLIKAVAGGGGRGMRIVKEQGAFDAALSDAREEARSAFGNAEVLIEKLVESPRHIEVQVFGDGETTLHLFERDCSLQRRHQKVIEEAPAPGMNRDVRDALCRAAIDAANAIGYTSAGTIEFIADARDGLRPDRFWFIEMNTRLQVEHPVTEAVTGIDLVEWQLRVARGEKLPKRQDEIALNGHAIEARLYAEDVPGGFRPAPGRIEHLVLPQNVRVDTGLSLGDDVSPHYDPLIAKLVSHRGTRTEALGELATALYATEIGGVTTNAGFLARLLEHEDIQSGNFDTGFVAKHEEILVPDEKPSGAATAIAAVVALGLNRADQHRGFSLWGAMRTSIALNGTTHQVEAGPDDAVVYSAEERINVQLLNDAWWVDGQKTTLRAVAVIGGVHVFGEGGGVFTVDDPLQRDQAIERHGDVQAPMPGLITEVFVTVGDPVRTGAPLVRLEAMKMVHTLAAPFDGEVKVLSVGVGDLVEMGAIIARLGVEGAQK